MCLNRNVLTTEEAAFLDDEKDEREDAMTEDGDWFPGATIPSEAAEAADATHFTDTVAQGKNLPYSDNTEMQCGLALFGSVS